LPLSRKKAPKDDTKNTSNTSSDFSITSQGVKDAPLRFLNQRDLDNGGSVTAIFNKTLRFLGGGVRSDAPPGVLLIFFILLMFYFMRARSALPDSYANSMLAQVFSPAHVFSRVFSLPKTIVIIGSLPVIPEVSYRESRTRSFKKVFIKGFGFRTEAFRNDRYEMDTRQRHSGMTPLLIRSLA
jgi:hypothetical protein